MAARKDMYMRRNGKIMLLQNGRLIFMEDDKTMMMDGTILTRDGSLRTPDGRTRMLREDEAVTVDGMTSDENDEK